MLLLLLRAPWLLFLALFFSEGDGCVGKRVIEPRSCVCLCEREREREREERERDPGQEGKWQGLCEELLGRASKLLCL